MYSFVHSFAYFRDLKPENFLMISADDDHHCKLVDFGLVAKVGDVPVLGGCHGTPGYIPPEMLTDRKHGDSSRHHIIILLHRCFSPNGHLLGFGSQTYIVTAINYSYDI